jgi:hypothetical protein
MIKYIECESLKRSGLRKAQENISKMVDKGTGSTCSLFPPQSGREVLRRLRVRAHPTFFLIPFLTGFTFLLQFSPQDPQLIEELVSSSFVSDLLVPK